jgi:hypothetical protein
MPAFDDGPGCRPRGVANLSRHCRHAGSLPQIQVRRGGVWTDVFHVAIRITQEYDRIYSVWCPCISNQRDKHQL